MLNGELLVDSSTDSQWFESSNGQAVVVAHSIFNDLNHTIELSFKTLCLASTLVDSGTSLFPPSADDVIGVFFAHIESIDGRSPSSHAGFTISFDQVNQKVIGVLDSFGGIPNRLKHPSQEDPETASQTFTASPSPTSQPESHRLNYLENELKALASAVNKQQTLVNDIDHVTQAEDDSDSSSDYCRSVKCTAKALLRYTKTWAKDCLHFLATHMDPKSSKSLDYSSVDSECYFVHSRQTRMYAAMKGEVLCSEKKVGQTHSSATSSLASSNHSLPDSSINGNGNTLTSDVFSYESGSRKEKFHKVVLPLGIVASALCASCLAVCLHRSCCNPRAKAERAAYREECQTRRQYARLARQHKWRQWWNKRLGRNTRPFSTDYEEKRSLIQTQERVLEQVMQQEIARIRHEQGYYDEELGAPTQPFENLPPYRSRAGSGRPPSYTSEPQQGFSQTILSNMATDLNSGLEDTYPASDHTPDSSIPNLSRRNSADTLDSNRSVV